MEKYIPLWKHPKMTDVAMHIVWEDKREDGKIQLCISWWNIGNRHAPYPMEVIEQVVTTPEWVTQLQKYR